MYVPLITLIYFRFVFGFCRKIINFYVFFVYMYMNVFKSVYFYLNLRTYVSLHSLSYLSTYIPTNCVKQELCYRRNCDKTTEEFVIQ